MKKGSTHDRIYNIIRNIPRGKVATYKLISEIDGTCTPRMVGYALSHSQSRMNLPWHRVINSRGEISINDPENNLLQKRMLENEGVIFFSNRVNLQIYLWKP